MCTVPAPPSHRRDRAAPRRLRAAEPIRVAIGLTIASAVICAGVVAAPAPRVAVRAIAPGGVADPEAAAVVAYLMGAPLPASDADERPSPTFAIALGQSWASRWRRLAEAGEGELAAVTSYSVFDGRDLKQAAGPVPSAAWQQALRSGPLRAAALQGCGGAAADPRVVRGGVAAAGLRATALPPTLTLLHRSADGSHLYGVELAERWRDARAGGRSCLGDDEGRVVRHRLTVRTDADGRATRVFGLGEWPGLAPAASPAATRSAAGAAATSVAPLRLAHGYVAFARASATPGDAAASGAGAVSGVAAAPSAQADAMPLALWAFAEDGAPRGPLIVGALPPTATEAAAQAKRSATERRLPPARAAPPALLGPWLDARPLADGRWLLLVALGHLDADGDAHAAALAAFTLAPGGDYRRFDLALPRSEAAGRWVCDVDGDEIGCSFDAPALPGAEAFAPRRLPLPPRAALP